MYRFFPGPLELDYRRLMDILKVPSPALFLFRQLFIDHGKWCVTLIKYAKKGYYFISSFLAGCLELTYRLLIDTPNIPSPAPFSFRQFCYDHGKWCVTLI